MKSPKNKVVKKKPSASKGPPVGAKANAPVPNRLEQLENGQSLGEVFAVTPAMTEALRDRALQLFTSREFEKCVAVLKGLAALGDVHPADAMLLSRCLLYTGQRELAFAARDSASRLLEGMNLVIPEA